MAVMNSKKKSMRKKFAEEEIDKVVESQAEDDSAWEKPIHIRRAKPAALSLLAVEKRCQEPFISL
jgi:hypothetical protein